MDMLKNKKGQVLENFGRLAIGIGTFAVIIIVTFLVMAQTKTAGINLIDTTSFTNQSTAITVDTFVVLNTNCINEEAMSVTQVFNASQVLLAASNYSVTLNTLNVSGATTNTGTYNISYSCKLKDGGYNSTETLQSATDDMPGWVPLIVIVINGGAILFMVKTFR